MRRYVRKVTPENIDIVSNLKTPAKGFVKPDPPKFIDTNTYISNTIENSKHYRDIYKEKYGTIPHNHDIHHINGNIKDNNIDNLIALPHTFHFKMHDYFYRKKLSLPSRQLIIAMLAQYKKYKVVKIVLKRKSSLTKKKKKIRHNN